MKFYSKIALLINIFSEIYGAYFRTAEKILARENVTEQEINEIISENAFKGCEKLKMVVISEKCQIQPGAFPWKCRIIRN